MATILVIDDDDDVRHVLRMVLEGAGHIILEAANGIAADHFIATETFDLVVTDILMPHKEGLETIIDLRRAGRVVPIIAISGGGRTGMTEFLNVAERFGADRTLKKPFRRAELLRLVAELLET
jgi:CheY-like chemotaxis protein